MKCFVVLFIFGTVSGLIWETDDDSRDLAREVAIGICRTKKVRDYLKHEESLKINLPDGSTGEKRQARNLLLRSIHALDGLDKNIPAEGCDLRVFLGKIVAICGVYTIDLIPVPRW